MVFSLSKKGERLPLNLYSYQELAKIDKQTIKEKGDKFKQICLHSIQQRGAFSPLILHHIGAKVYWIFPFKVLVYREGGGRERNRFE